MSEKDFEISKILQNLGIKSESRQYQNNGMDGPNLEILEFDKATHSGKFQFLI